MYKEQNPGYQALQNLKCFIVLASFFPKFAILGRKRCWGAFFEENELFRELKGKEVSCLSKMSLDAKWKQKLSGASRNNLSNKHQSFLDQSVQNLNYFLF